MATTWMGIVLDGEWLPKGRIPMTFLRNEYRGRDVIRSAWTTTAGYDIQVAQTATIFALQVRPPAELAVKGRLDTPKARAILRELFRREGQRRSYQGEAIPIAELNQKIVRFSVDEAAIRKLEKDQVIIAHPRTREAAGVKRPSGEIAAQEVSPRNPNWDRTYDSYAYWFRQVHWWTDGTILGVYFLKVDGPGAWLPSFVSSTDLDWFAQSAVPRDRSGRVLKR